ncbi:MAG: hypothetical protein K2X39_00545 [Silvanigrellaceae bacterium]|nr:hypothetical protein [Silvanigrellaceae bacterium]
MSNQLGPQGHKFFDKPRMPVPETLVHAFVTHPLGTQIDHTQNMENAQIKRSPEQPPHKIIAAKELLIEHLNDIKNIIKGNIPEKYRGVAPEPTAPTLFSINFLIKTKQ